MEKLPPEIIFPLLRNLNIRDCVRFCSTCRHFNDFLPALTEIFPSFDCQTLHLRERRDLSYAAFLIKHGLSVGVERIKLNVYLCQEDSVNDLRAIFDQVPNRILELESVAIDPVTVPHPSAIALLSDISVQEFHWNDFACKLQSERGEHGTAFGLSLGTAACTASWPLFAPGSLFRSVKSVSIRLSSVQELPSFLSLQNIMPQLSELSIAFPEYLRALDESQPYYSVWLNNMTNDTKSWPNVKKLSLTAGIDIANHVLDPYLFPNVESVTLDISKYDECGRLFISFACMCARLPNGLMELHLFGKHLTADDYGYFVNRRNLKIVTHVGYRNVSADVDRVFWDLDRLPTPSSVESFIRLKPVLFQDLRFKLKEVTDWTILTSLLRLVPTLSSLAIVIDNRSSMNIEIASPKVTTKVARLFMSHILCEDKRGLNILSSFEHVAELIIKIDYRDRNPGLAERLSWAKCQKALRAGYSKLRLCSVSSWKDLPCLEPMMDVLVLTHLRLHVQYNDEDFNLNKLLQVVGTKLKELQIVYYLHVMPRIIPTEINALLCQPELETIKIRYGCQKPVYGYLQNDDGIRELAREITSWNKSWSWPQRLKRITLSSIPPRRSNSDPPNTFWKAAWSYDIILENSNGELKERHLTRPMPMDESNRDFHLQASTAECLDQMKSRDPYFS